MRKTEIVFSCKTYFNNHSVIYNSTQFKKIDPYDWFCGPGSYLCIMFHLIFIQKVLKKVFHLPSSILQKPCYSFI